ncbi:MAG: hypothetical protein QHI38_07430 [Armatimonadota bacterium]|nr:hypothetical protein [Armatimonadota bacterium]
MADRKSLAIGLGVLAGATAVAFAIACYSRKHAKQQPPDVNEIFESARETIRKLNETLEGLHSAATASSNE